MIIKNLGRGIACDECSATSDTQGAFENIQITMGSEKRPGRCLTLCRYHLKQTIDGLIAETLESAKAASL